MPMREPTFSRETMTMRGLVMDGSTGAIYCDVFCAEDSGEASEDSLVEVNATPDDICAFCGKPIEATQQGDALEAELLAVELEQGGEHHADN